LAVTYAGDLNNKVDIDIQKGTVGGNGSKLYAYFGLTAIENLGIDIGLGYKFPVTTDKGISISYKGTDGDDHDISFGGGSDVTVNSPIAIGLGVNFNAGAFGIKARFQGQFGGTIKSSVELMGVSVPIDDAKLDTVIDVDILPSYAINDKATIALSAGLQITKPDGSDATVGWHIEPYVTVKSNWWAPNFYFGIRLESDGVKGADDKTVTNWSIPMGIVFAF